MFPFAESKQTLLRRFKMLLEVSQIDRMREIPSAKDIDALPLRPPGETLGFHLSTTGVAETRMDMQIGNDTHTKAFPPIGLTLSREAKKTSGIQTPARQQSMDLSETCL